MFLGHQAVLYVFTWLRRKAICQSRLAHQVWEVQRHGVAAHRSVRDIATRCLHPETPATLVHYHDR